MIAIAFAASAVPWINVKWTFSLRSMLIATALIAVVLGLVAWASG